MLLCHHNDLHIDMLLNRDAAFGSELDDATLWKVQGSILSISGPGAH